MPRVDVLNGVFHLIARGNEKRNIFLEPDDYAFFVRRMTDLVREFRISMFSWTLMPNHVHFLIERGGAPLAKFMQRLLGSHAHRFNAKYSRAGHLFQNRYKSFLVEGDAYFLSLVRYINLNPLKGGVVSSLLNLDDFPWSSHRALCGFVKPEMECVDRVLELLADERLAAVAAYREFLEAGVHIQDSAGWANLVQHPKNPTRGKKIVVKPVKRTQTELLVHVAGVFGVSGKQILSASRKRIVVQARARFVRLAVDSEQATRKELGLKLKLSENGISRLFLRGFMEKT